MTKVFVDDHFHYQDEDHRYEHGEFENPDEAVAVCKQIVDGCLEHMLKPGMTADALFQLYAMFGEDPFVIPGNGFYAWDYAKERCEVLAHPSSQEHHCCLCCCLTNTKLTEAELAPFRVAFGNVFDTVVVHQTGKRKPVEVTPYARISAIMGKDIMPKMRTAKKVLEEQGLTNLVLATHGTLAQLRW
jgi:hypothetical protein